MYCSLSRYEAHPIIDNSSLFGRWTAFIYMPAEERYYQGRVFVSQQNLLRLQGSKQSRICYQRRSAVPGVLSSIIIDIMRVHDVPSLIWIKSYAVLLCNLYL